MLNFVNLKSMITKSLLLDNKEGIFFQRLYFQDRYRYGLHLLEKIIAYFFLAT